MLCREIKLKSEEHGRKIKADTLFFGGGTPSLMKPHHIEPVMKSLREFADFDSAIEITMECNPGTIDIKYLEFYKELGVNRISFGVQSFHEKDLKFLERIHSPSDVGKAVDAARSCGFENISIDLMFALPDQTKEEWAYNLNEAVSLDVKHISAYSLIYEPGTPLYDEYISGKVKAQNEDNDVELYEITDKILSAAGFEQYEVSNYAKPGFKCKHNLKYWSCGEYFGFGPSAHSYENGRRYWNYRDNDIYFAKIAQNQAPEESGETLSRKQMLFEKLYLGLRAEGVNLEEFKESGVDFTSGKSDFLLEMSDCNYLIFDENKIKLTNKGYFIGDKITLELSESIDDIC